MQRTNQVDPTTKRTPARRVVERTRQAAPTTERSHPLVMLQRTMGNAAVNKMIARAGEEEELAMKRDSDAGGGGAEVGLEGGPISESLSNQINSRRGGGTGLDSATLNRMEGAFGQSFADVRIHTGSEADSLNRSVSAKAFTTGSDIFLSQNSSPSDSSLLAHELTHVVQQREQTSGSGPMTVTAAGDQHERAADSAAAAVSSGAPAGIARLADGDASTAIEREAMPEEEEMPM
jgi:Domain of unknown function (DUF4157)